MIVSSATIDALSFNDFFDDGEVGVTILKLEGGRTFPSPHSIPRRAMPGLCRGDSKHAVEDPPDRTPG